MPRRLLARRALRGATFTEYLIVVGAIALLALVAFVRFGDTNRQHMATLSQEMAGVPGAGQGGVAGGGTRPLPGNNGGNFSGGTWGGGGQAGTGSGSGGTPGAGSGTGGTGGSGGTGSEPGGGDWGDWGDLLNPPGSGGGSIGGGNNLNPIIDPGNGAGGEFCAVPGGNAPTNAYVGNPINLANGNKFQLEIDYQGLGEFALRFERAYNSHLVTERSSLGPGWQHNYDRRIVEQADGFLRISRADGRRHLFRSEGQHWISTDGNIDRLQGLWQDEQHLGWRYLPGTGGAEYYDTHGRLQRVVHPHGQQQQLHYNEDGQLHSVTDAYGQQLRFHYLGLNLARVDSPDGRQHHFAYDDFNGTLLSARQRGNGLLDRLGHSDVQRHYHYEDNQHTGYLTGITDESGRRYATWAYDHLGRAILSEHGQGVERLELEYRTNQTRVTNAAGLVATYHLIDVHGIKRVSRIEGEATAYCPESRQRHLYADTGFLTAAIDAEGRATVMRRDERGLIIEEIRGVRWQDEQPELQPESQRITREWHPDLPVVLRERHYQRSAEQHWQAQYEVFNQYDDRGRLSLHTRINLSEQQQPYANQGASRSWVYQYDYHDAAQTLLKQVHITDPRQQLLAEQSDPSAQIAYSQLDYDAQGRFIASTNALGHRTRYSHHHANGRPGRILDPNGLETRLHYNAQGQLARIERRGEHTSEIAVTYLANGLPSSLHLENGLHLGVEYNDALQVTGLINGQGERIAITPNAVSGSWEQLSIHDRSGQTTQQQQRQHDELGRVIALLGNAGQHTRVQHDKSGNAVRIDQASDQEPSGLLSTVQHYDSLSRLTRHIDPAQGETRLSYDNRGRLTEVIAANDARTTYTYDGLGQLLQEHSPDTGTRVHHYDSAGQRIKSHALGQPEHAVQYHYDLLGRLTHIRHPDPVDDIQYIYDQHSPEHGAGIGRLTRIVDRHSQIDYRYDRHGNLLSDTRTLHIDGQTHVQRIEYGYSHGSQLTSLTYPNGQRISYQYQHGLPIGISLHTGKQQQTLLSDIQHQPFGPMAQWTYGNGLTQRLTHDLDGRINAITVTNSSNNAIWQQAYQYDRQNNIIGIDRSEGQSRYQQQFGYDLVQRLIRDQGPYGEQQFDYDAVGNRLSQVQRSQDTSEEQRIDYHYEPASNRLIGTRDNALILDSAGNTLHESDEQKRDYRYNAQNRLSEYHENGQLKARYHYNALGQRTHKAVIQDNGSEQHTLFHYGLQGELLGETQLHANQPGQTQNIVWLQNRPVAALDSSHSETEQQNAAPSIAWLHSDHLLTARAATDANQKLIWRWHSDAFGVGEAESLTSVTKPEAQSLTLNLRFPGQYHDQESGLYYNYFRTYDPSKGRYTQSDPIGLAGGISTFGYVYGSPVGYVDPLGLYTEIIIWQPVRYGSSSFGHVSANINGVNYSWGPGGWDTNPSAEVYAANQTNFRSGVGTVLSLSTEQEKKLIECYTKKRKEYSVWTNNCGDPHKECLEEALGHSISSSFFPVSIGNDLLSSPYYSSSKFYEGPDRGFWDDAPWAR